MYNSGPQSIVCQFVEFILDIVAFTEELESAVKPKEYVQSYLYGRNQEQTSDVLYNEERRVARIVELICDDAVGGNLAELEDSLVKWVDRQWVESNQRENQTKEVHHLYWIIQSHQEHMKDYT